MHLPYSPRQRESLLYLHWKLGGPFSSHPHQPNTKVHWARMKRNAEFYKCKISTLTQTKISRISLVFNVGTHEQILQCIVYNLGDMKPYHTHAYQTFRLGMKPFIISALFMALLSITMNLTIAVGYLI